MDSDDDTLSRRGRQRRLLLQAIGGGAVAGTLAMGVRAPARASQKSRDPILDVAIIGGGLSGLTSARDLVRAGRESFVVLEARNRVGGRTCNHDLGHGVISEGGGQWIGPGQTAIADLAREFQVGTFDSFYRGKTVYLVGDGKVAQDVGNGGLGGGAEAIRKLNELARGVPSGAPWTAANAVEIDRQSLGDWLATQSLSDDDKLTFNLSATLTYGAPPDKLGLLHYLSVINSSNCDLERLESMQGGAQEKRFVGGSHVLSVKMAGALGDKVRLSSPVRKIVGWDREVVELHTDQGITRARQVIAASSPSLCNQIIFDPPLPDDRAQMQKLWPTNGRIRKTVHVYSHPFWRDADLNGQVIQIGGPILWSADNSPPDASVGIITAFVKEGSLPADPKKAEGILSSIYARALGDEALQPTQYHEIDWGTVDSWSLSCTSPCPPGFLTKWGKFIHPRVGRLIWSGTDTADIWAGAMDGAVRSGHRAALQALHALARG